VSCCNSRVSHLLETPKLADTALFAATNPEVVENAIKYIIFLTNVNQLYDVALGMYDFKLVLMVAQYSQKVRLCLSLTELV
jgi:hypothetical protein